MIAFWHKPAGFFDKRWHAYSEYGEGRMMTLCGEFALIGVMLPSTARKRKPRSGRCGICLRRSTSTKATASSRSSAALHSEGEKK